MKILFVCNNMHIGGIQRSLVNLLNALPSTYDITLLLFYKTGAYLDELPKNVKVITGNFGVSILGLSNKESKRLSKFTFLHHSFWAAFSKIFGVKIPFAVLTRLFKIKGKYDAAISFMQNSDYHLLYGGCNEFVINSVKAKQKISFIHADFKNYIGNNKYNINYYKKFDKIACCSASVRDVFLDVCNQYKDKTFVVHNSYNFKAMDIEANEYIAEHTKDVCNIFTAARISSEKGIDRMLPIFKRLKDEGESFVWRIAGGGVDEPKVREMIMTLELQDNIKLLGNLKNPYPYFKSADLFLLPSQNEAAPMVYGEAAHFNTFILTTNTVSAKELVEDLGAGIVCENNDDAIYEALKKVLTNEITVTSSFKSDNQNVIDEFEYLLS